VSVVSESVTLDDENPQRNISKRRNIV